MGKTAWENMLRRSRVTIRSIWEFQPEFYEDDRTLGGEPTGRQDLMKEYQRGTGALARFFQELAWCQSGRHGCAANGMQTLLNDNSPDATCTQTRQPGAGTYFSRAPASRRSTNKSTS